jgi:RNA polymerase-binding transcription factor
MSEHERDLQTRYRRRIEIELDELVTASGASQDGRAPVVLDQQSVGRVSRIDAMQAREMALASERRRRGRILALRAALKRIDEGEFGYCESCGESIAPGRLDVDPTAITCVSCARAHER